MLNTTDPAQIVLRDIEHVIWLTLLLGLVLFAGWRFVFRKKNTIGEPDREAQPVTAGLAVSHFTWFDLLLLPLVLIKFSVTLQLAAVWLTERFVPSPESTGAKVAAAAETSTADWTPLVIVLDFGINVILVGLIVLAIQSTGRRSVTEVFGLNRLAPLPLSLWIAAGSLIVTPAILLFSNSLPDWLAPIFGEKIEEQAAVENIRKSAGDSPFKLMLVFNAVLIAPIVEEVVFRGYFYGALKQKTSALFSAFITAALFSAAHNNVLAFLPLFGFALCLTLFYEASRSLWVPIGMHATFNAVNVGLILAGFGEGNGG
jgi:membrane protease YdiL (CAAX protease family)